MGADRFGTVQLVWGSKILEVDGSTLRDEGAGFKYVAVDLGAGDGRFVYRLARTHADWFCVAIDANADGLRDRSRRAARKPSRGGAPNARFVRAAAENLPRALESFADVIYVLYPWGRLLRAVLAADLEVLLRIARLG